MTTTQQIITVGMAVLATMLTRFVPFIVFRPGRPTPKYIMYLGKSLPASVFALLVVYCLRDISFIPTPSSFLPTDTIAQLLAVAVTAAVHVWRRNMMWSIAMGTICYMTLIRTIM